MTDVTPDDGCPAPDAWQRLLAGDGGAAEAALTQHLDRCPACRDRLAALAGTAEFGPTDVDRLRGDPAPPGLRRVLDAANGFLDESAADPPDFLKPADRPGLIGRLGRYGVVSVIGRGGMGVVLKAVDDSLQRVVAIKVLAPHLAGAATARKRFVREAQAAAAVSHDHVVTIHSVEDDGGTAFLVMQFVAGRSLQDRLDAEGPLGVKEALRIGVQTAAGLAAAHAQGLVHRDVKPANILLENGIERVKLTDFGLARAADDASLTQSGVVAGTPLYMSPEQARGEPVDHRSDLFSLGSVLYAMLAGRPPFRAGSTHAVLRRVAEDAPRPVREVNPGVPELLSDYVARLHAKDPADRPQTAAEVAGELGGYLARLQHPAAESGLEPLARPRGWAARRWAAAAVVALLGAAGLGWYFRAPPPADDRPRVSEINEPTRAAPPPRPPRPEPLGFPAAEAAAKQAQQAWADYLGRPVREPNAAGLDMVVVPPGEFLMGSSDDDVAAEREKAEGKDAERRTDRYLERVRTEAPQHRVRVTRPFALSAHEVTVGQFRRFAEETGRTIRSDREGGFGSSGGKWAFAAEYNWRAVGYPQTDDHPVVNVGWEEARAFCDWAGGRDARRYRLPTEAEWEYACRAGTAGRLPWGDQPTGDFAWHRLNANGRTQPVGRRRPNAFGLADMCGNAAEWCHDWFARYADPAGGVAVDPTGPPAGSDRVVRGGSVSHWLQRACCSPYRGTVDTNDRGIADRAVGFRVLSELPPPAGSN